MDASAIPDPVADDEVLYRRIPCDRPDLGLFEARPDGSLKIGSQAFSERNYQPSVHRAKLCAHDPSYSQEDERDGVVSVVTESVRAITVTQYDKDEKPVALIKANARPDPEPGDDAHAVIYTEPDCPNKKVFRRLCERLSLLASWEIRPRDV